MFPDIKFVQNIKLKEGSEISTYSALYVYWFVTLENKVTQSYARETVAAHWNIISAIEFEKILLFIK